MVSIGDDPWQHVIDADHYQSADHFETLLLEQSSRPFLKIAKKIPLEQWDELDLFFESNFVALLSILAR